VNSILDDGRRNRSIWQIVLPAITLVAGVCTAEAFGQFPGQAKVLDDFESYRAGDLPLRWKYDRRAGLIPLTPDLMHPKEQFYVAEDNGNKVLRVYTEGEAVHIMMGNEADGFDWDLREYPGLEWDWRALSLPADAREDEERLNDSGVGLYVIFKLEGFLIKRPKTIKYVYSSTLPVGSVVSYGKLKVLVVSSALDGTGKWIHIERNVREDSRRLFGDDPPRRPLSIRLWSDSDNTGGIAEADFDNIRFLPAK